MKKHFKLYTRGMLLIHMLINKRSILTLLLVLSMFWSSAQDNWEISGIPDCPLTLTPHAKTVNQGAGSITIQIAENGNPCQWEASSTSNWVTNFVPAGGTGRGSVTVNYVATGSHSDEEATIHIGNQIFILTQRGAIVSCDLSINPYKNHNVESEDGFISIEVISSGTECSWNASSNQTWAKVSQGTGQGSRIVKVNYYANPLTTLRKATITIAGYSFLLTQRPPMTCPPKEPKKTLTISNPINDLDCHINNGFIEARDKIILNGTFAYNSATDAALTIKLNEEFILPATNSINQIDGPSRTELSGEVGSIPGSIDVSPTGAASYTIPIEMPTGINGLAPSLSINYNSNGGNSILGLGWDIGGVSRITRGPSTIFADGSIDPLDYDSNDRFFMGGNELVAISGIYGDNNAQYHTLADNFSKIVSIGGSSNTPDKFEVWTPGGLIITYGGNSNSELAGAETLVWSVSNIRDLYGNSINYTYHNTNDEFWIEKITYAGNEVKFLYEERPDKNEMYMYDKKLKQNVQLRKIKLSSQGTLYREYSFNYVFNEYYVYLRLNEITLASGHGKKYNSTIINWESNSTSSNPNLPGDVAGNRMLFGNFNKDNTLDYIYYQEKSSYTSSDVLTVKLSKEDGTYDTETINLSSDFRAIFLADKDNDGRDELCKVEYSSSHNGYRVFHLSYYYTTTSASFVPLSLYGEVVYFDNTANIFIQTGDFNGDSKVDYLAQDQNKNPISIYINGDKNYDLTYSGTNDLVVEDVNGDGKDDMIILNSSNVLRVYGFNPLEQSNWEFLFSKTFSSSTSKFHFYPGDFNGDGKSDILVYNLRVPEQNDNWHIYYSNGKAFVDPKNITLDSADPNSGNWFEITINNYKSDGRDEIGVIYAPNIAHMDIHYCHSGEYKKESRSIQMAYEQAKFIEACKRSRYNTMVSTFDNTFNYGEYYYQKVCANYYHSSSLTNVVESITDGFNITTGITYGTAFDPLVCDPEISILENFEKRQIPGGKLVKNIKYGGVSDVSYTYKGPKGLKGYPGFIGFEQVTSVDNITNIKKLAEYKTMDNIYTPYLETVESFETTSGEKSLGKIVSNYTYKNPYTGKPIYFTYPTAKTSIGSRGFITTTTYGDADNYGNLSSIVTAKGIAKKVKVTKDFIYNPISNTSQYFPNKLDNVTETRKNLYNTGNSTEIRKTVYSYNSKNQLAYKYIQKSNGTTLITEQNIFDPSTGLLKTKKVTADGKTRFTSYAYEGTNRFVNKVTNHLDHAVSSVTDPVSGKVTSKTDANGLTTTYTYDNFGRLTEATRPDGNKVNTVLSYDTQYFYKETTTVTGLPSTVKYYNRYGQLKKETGTDMFNNTVTTTYAYNAKGQLISTVPIHGTNQLATIGYQYEFDGKPKSVTKTIPGGDIFTTSYGYTDATRQVTITTPRESIVKTFNEAGLLTKQDNGAGEIEYKYNPDGLTESITYNGSTISMDYDYFGNKLSTSDPNAGTTSATYNNWGEMLSSIDANGNAFTYTYDDMSRLKTKLDHTTGITTTMDYDAQLIGALDKVFNTEGEVGYTYDTYGRVLAKTDKIDGVNYTTGYTYNSLGQVTRVDYPSDFAVMNEYQNGGLLAVKKTDGGNIWKANSVNTIGQVNSTTLGNNLNVSYTFDKNYRPERIQAGTVFDYGFEFYKNGNLKSRTDHLTATTPPQTESFDYDGMDRLTHWLNNSKTASYYANGNINQKTDVGTYMYEHATKVHAVTKVTNPTDLLGLGEQSTRFNSIQKLDMVKISNDSLKITHGPLANRIKQVNTIGGSIKTKIYSGAYEKETLSDGTTNEIHYIGGGQGLAAIYIKNGSTGNKLYYTMQDYQGSILALINEDGTTVAERYAFDPWGNRRNPDDWSQKDTRTSFLIDRGYTGHEHLGHYDIINMNGRVYDPTLGRFLSPDPILQDMGDSQNLNRYSYVNNNPLFYTDPSGYSMASDLYHSGGGGGYTNWGLVNWANENWHGGNSTGRMAAARARSEAVDDYIKAKSDKEAQSTGSDYVPLENVGPEYIGGLTIPIGLGSAQLVRAAQFVVTGAMSVALIKYLQENPVFGNSKSWVPGRGEPFMENTTKFNNKNYFNSGPGVPDWLQWIVWGTGGAAVGKKLYDNIPSPIAPEYVPSPAPTIIYPTTNPIYNY